jgi:hypothetical protein
MKITSNLVRLFSIAKERISFSSFSLFHQGSWKYIYPTDIMIKALEQEITPSDYQIIRMQLEFKPFQIQYNKGRVNVFSYADKSKKDVPVLPLPKYEDFWVQIDLMSDKRKYRSLVCIYKGYLHHIQFSKPAGVFQGKLIEIISTKKVTGKSSFTRAIDRQEHGR